MSETTLFIVKPDAYPQANLVLVGLGALLAAEGKSVRMVYRVSRSLTPGQVRDLYAEALNALPKEYGEAMIQSMISAPSLIVLLKGESAVARVRAACGPTDPREAGAETLRGRFGDKAEGAPKYRNAVHASDSPESARREAFALLPEDWAAHFD